MIKSLLATAILAVLSTSSMASTTADVTAQFYIGGYQDGTATFVGTDTNLDGSLSLDELTSFSLSIQSYGVSLSDVNAFGTYNIATNTWSPNAEAWGGAYDTGSFVTWNNNSLAVTTMAGFSAVTSEVTHASAVPEPANAALLLAGLGLMGAVARRKASKQA